MNDFIQSVSKNLGIGESTGKTATAGLLGLVQKNISGGDFSSLVNKLPGASELLKTQASEGSGSEKGGLGGLMGMAGSVLGGKAGSLVGVAAALQKTGLGMDQVGPFVSQFFGHLKTQGASDFVPKILEGLPDLKKFIS